MRLIAPALRPAVTWCYPLRKGVRVLRQNVRKHDVFTRIDTLPGEDQEEFFALHVLDMADATEAFEKPAEEGKPLHLCLRYEKHFQRQFDNVV